MRKLLAIIRREYVQRVRSRFFVVATIAGPLMMAAFTVGPVYMAGIRAGGPKRIAIVDQTGKLSDRLREALMNTLPADDENDREEAPFRLNSNQQDQLRRTTRFGEQRFFVETIDTAAKPLEQIKHQMNQRINRGELDFYIIIPPDIFRTGKAELYGRNTGDAFTRQTVGARLSAAVQNQRLAEERIPQNVVRELNRRVDLTSTKVSTSGEEKDSGAGLFLVFTFGFLMYVTTLMYGQMVLGAVIEEKETRIAEVLFASVKSFPLMMGKLIGVSLVALTQLAIWGAAVLALTIFAAARLTGRDAAFTLPHVPAVVFVYFVVYFLLGYFLYATIYAVVGSMVTTAQEGGQLSLPVVFLLVASIYFAFPVMRAPNSSLAFWASMFPFFAPIAMMVRIVTETPPLWQIALSIAISLTCIVGLTWVTARVYRVGMLMTGKRATIPELWRWVRQP